MKHSQIYKLRIKQGLSQSEVANILKISRPSYINIENGKKELTLSQFKVLADLFKATLEELQFDATMITSGETAIPKFKQVILNCIKFGSNKKDGKITKTKLAKLAYLSEFKWFYDNFTHLTGLAYKKLPQGPVPDIYFRIIDELFLSGLINIERKGSAFMISLNENPSNNLLSKQELDTISKVSKKWQSQDTQQIVDFTHNQLPWKICRPSEVIPYELITQEDPNNIF